MTRRWSDKGFWDWFKLSSGVGAGLYLSQMLAVVFSSLFGCCLVFTIIVALVGGLVAFSIWAIPYLEKADAARLSQRDTPRPPKR